MKITVKWEVEDGYAGKSRPQKTIIDTEMDMQEGEWDGMSYDERREYIEECVQEDFDQRITFAIEDYGI